jgi:DNA-3-methyladenine glycosylase II
VGVQALGQREPRLAAVVQRLGAPPLWGRRPGFATLVRIILEQQVSLAAARTMYRRLHAHAGGVSPRSVEALGVHGLREFGLTRQKATYCHGLAVRLLDGRLDLARVARSSDESGRSMLLEVPGLGPWSADIYFLMALRRPDVWPHGDLALAIGMREVLQLRSVPTREQQVSIARRWAPWRSVAARIIWSHYLQR